MCPFCWEMFCPQLSSARGFVDCGLHVFRPRHSEARQFPIHFRVQRNRHPKPMLLGCPVS